MPKITINKVPTEIPNEVLLKDVDQHRDDYMYERENRLGCSKLGIEPALKCLALVKKKIFVHLKA